jgi:hypothetical protein
MLGFRAVFGGSGRGAGASRGDFHRLKGRPGVLNRGSRRPDRRFSAPAPVGSPAMRRHFTIDDEKEQLDYCIL